MKSQWSFGLLFPINNYCWGVLIRENNDVEKDDDVRIDIDGDMGMKHIVGGVGLPETVEKISFEAKLVEGSNGGSIGKTTVKYQTKGDAKPIEKEVEEGKAKGDALFKAIEGYVLANPNYN
ncbi:pathogenesis-related protein bet V I family protein [Medicago truncatula]|uniref:Pathogenesis-related protein bet V I family protein n=1 Tax=Medicago truncatula TaxID=3880 RepID=A0A072V2I7_MEDTR|nr:pathogenesis-related protein bet V I family protein [Medicago truncatula]